MTLTSIFLRNFSFFYLAVIYVGTLNVMPQLFFLEYYPENKTELMALFLILGFLSAIIGVLISHRNIVHSKGVFNKKRISHIFILTIITFSALFAVKDIVSYFLSFLVLKFASGYLHNDLDQYFVRITPKSQTATHVKSHLLWYMSGCISAPFYLSIFYPNIIVNIVVFSTIGIFAMYFAMRNVTENISNQSYTKNDVLQAPLKISDRLFIFYSAVVFTVVISLPALIIFLLQDYYHLDNAETKGGILVGCMSVISIVSICSTFFFKRPIVTVQIHRHVESKLFPFSSNLFAIILLFLSITMIYFRLSSSFMYLLFCCLPAGIGHGLFINSTRNYASSISIQLNRQRLLSIYNNLSNYGALTSLGIILPVSFLSKRLSFDFYAIILKINVGLIIFAAFIFFLTIISLRKY